MASEIIVADSTHSFKLIAEKDGAVWNLSSATVELILRDPDGIETTNNATVTDGANGIASYSSAASDHSKPGNWKRTWKVTDSSIVQKSRPIPFRVTLSP